MSSFGGSISFQDLPKEDLGYLYIPAQATLGQSAAPFIAILASARARLDVH